MKKRNGLLKIRDIAPSPGKRRPGHRGHQPSNVCERVDRIQQTQMMLQSLIGQGWQFEFTVKAMSPRGFPYAGEGKSISEAFLRALGYWRSGKTPEEPKPAPQVKSWRAIKREGAHRHKILVSRARSQEENIGPAGVLLASWQKWPIAGMKRA